MGAHPRPLDRNGEFTALLVEQASSLNSEGQANQLQAGELQIDFDCAESKLEGYRVWVEALRRKTAPVPVIITALPSWLKQTSFKPLVTAADGYILQVHSLDRPRGINEPFTLCDPTAAQRAVERAGT